MAHGQNNTSNSQDWIRNVAFNNTMLENFNEENFMIAKYVEFIDDLDGAQTELNIPGVGNTSISDYTEGQIINTEAVSTTMFKFKPDQAKAGGISITDELLRDSYYINQVLPYVADDQTRACYEDIEKYFFTLSQTLPFKVNEVQHRLEATGVNGELSINDFSRAKSVIRRSAKLYNNFVSFITPEQASQIEQSIGIVAPANSKWEQVADQGLMDQTGMSLLMNIHGVDVYVSSFVPKGIDSTTAGGSDHTGSDAVMVFSATARKAPFIGAWVERPNFTFERFESKRTTEHYVYMCFGGKLIYPQNLVVIECKPATI